MDSKDWNPVLKAIAMGIWVLILAIVILGMGALSVVGK